MTTPKEPDFPFDETAVRAMLRAAFSIWEVIYQQRYLNLLPHVRRLGLEVGTPNDYIKALTVTPEKIFKIQFDELELFVFVHALNELDNPTLYPKVKKE